MQYKWEYQLDTQVEEDKQNNEFNFIKLISRIGYNLAYAKVENFQEKIESSTHENTSQIAHEVARVAQQIERGRRNQERNGEKKKS